MPETFAKPVKRDYVRCIPRPDVQTVVDQRDSWFEDYNNAILNAA